MGGVITGTLFCSYSMIGEVMEDGNLNPNVKGIYTLAMDHIFSHVEV